MPRVELCVEHRVPPGRLELGTTVFIRSLGYLPLELELAHYVRQDSVNGECRGYLGAFLGLSISRNVVGFPHSPCLLVAYYSHSCTQSQILLLLYI